MPLDVDIHLKNFGLRTKVRRVSGVNKGRTGEVLSLKYDASGLRVLVGWGDRESTWHPPEDLEIAPRIYKVGDVVQKYDYPMLPVGTVVIDPIFEDRKRPQAIYRKILTPSEAYHYEVMGKGTNITEESARFIPGRIIIWLPDDYPTP